MVEKVLVDKELIHLALHKIITCEMLERNMGQYDEVLKIHLFNNDEYKKINEIIKNDMFPDGFYKLRDALGE